MTHLDARRHTLRRFTTATLLGAISFALASFAEEAKPVAAQDFVTQSLEEAFWYCDYVATTQGAHALPMATCTFVTDKLRHEKFGEDFERFVMWWRMHKPGEHAKLARIRGE